MSAYLPSRLGLVSLSCPIDCGSNVGFRVLGQCGRGRPDEWLSAGRHYFTLGIILIPSAFLMLVPLASISAGASYRTTTQKDERAR